VARGDEWIAHQSGSLLSGDGRAVVARTMTEAAIRCRVDSDRLARSVTDGPKAWPRQR
jgi:hypothetical protein